MNPTNAILLTIDVEDWFQVENFKQQIPFSSWPSHELRIEKNTHRLLDLLDSGSAQRPFKPQAKRSSRLSATVRHERAGEAVLQPPAKLRATFFILGWIAERLPHLVGEIHSRGHEVASHGYFHNLCTEQSHGDLKRDLSDSKKLLEDIIGAPVFGYRAPSFVINNNILKVIEDSGYLYDSSFNSFSMHDRYGEVNLVWNGKKGIVVKFSNNFYELPISNMKIGNRVFPLGGGAYFRLIPSSLFKMGVQSILNKEKAYLSYIHPWEIDSEQPRVSEAPWFFKFRHYVNLNKTHSKLSKFIRNFQQHRFITCSQYISELEN